MWPTGYPRLQQAARGSGAGPTGPATATLRSSVALLASMLRCAGIVYIVVQTVIWHSFYTSAPWRLTAPVLAVLWAAAVVTWLRGSGPSAVAACADAVVYAVLAIGGQAGVPPAVRDDTFSWLVIGMTGQLMVSAWYAPGPLRLPFAVASPAAYLGGAMMLPPVTSARTAAGAAALLLVGGIAHVSGQRAMSRRAAAADADLDGADRAARKRYAALRGAVVRREHERLVHDTVLNTLTALARPADRAAAAWPAGRSNAVSRCRQDVELLEAALRGSDGLAADGLPADLGDQADLADLVGRPADLLAGVRAVTDAMRDRGLTVHLEAVQLESGVAASALPAAVAAALAGAVRAALANVAEHAGTGEAWVTVDRGPHRVEVTVRDSGVGFDPARAGQGRLGLRRSIAERVAECGGRASVRSAPGEGTEVCLRWPAEGAAGPDPLALPALVPPGPVPPGPVPPGPVPPGPVPPGTVPLAGRAVGGQAW